MTRNTLRTGLLAVLLLAVLLIQPTPLAHAAVSVLSIDEFDVAQTGFFVLSPATDASSTQVGTMLGGERDMAVHRDVGLLISAEVTGGEYAYGTPPNTNGYGTIIWDGTDGSDALDQTGLGGVDLTDGGINDSFWFLLTFADVAGTVEITVYDGTNSSTFSGAIAPTAVDAPYYIPFSAFSGTADFTNVGAIEMRFSGDNLDATIDFLRATTLAEITKTDSLASDEDSSGGTITPGDIIEYTVVIDNPTDQYGASLTDATFTSGVPEGATLLNDGTYPISDDCGGDITGVAGGDSVTVEWPDGVSAGVDGLPDGTTCTVTFFVQINSPAEVGQLVCQGFLTYAERTGSLPSDDPDTSDVADPTVTIIEIPFIEIDKAASIINNVGDPGVADVGDYIEYTVTVYSTGGVNDAAVVQGPAPAGTTVIANFADGGGTCGIDSTLTDTAALTEVQTTTITAGTSCTLIYVVEVTELLATTIDCTATSTGVASNNIDTGAASVPTSYVPPVPPSTGGSAANQTSSGPAVVVTDPAITKNGSPENATVGEAVTWTIDVTNPGTEPINNVVVNDTVPTQFDIVSATATQGTVDVNGQDVTANLGTLVGGASVRITISTVANDSALPGTVCNTASMSSDASAGVSASVDCVTFFPDALPPTGGPSPLVATLRTIAPLIALISLAGVGGFILMKRRIH